LLDRILEKPAIVFHKVGGWALAVMMVLTAGDVFLRNVFNRPILGAFEITESLMTIVVASGLAYVTVTKSQIRVEVLHSRLPQRTQQVFTVITDFFSLGFCILLSWQSFVYMEKAYESGVKWGVLLIPTYPFIAVVALGMILLAAVLLKDFLKLIQELKK
jgi:TRAP-type C4-dicarboxylate transport system permease small subunit